MKSITEERYNKLSKREKLLYIAKDVLAQLKIGKMKGAPGNYCDIAQRFYLKDIKSSFDTIKQCKVCVIGSVLVAIARIKNQLTYQDISCDSMNAFNNNFEINKKAKFIGKILSELFSMTDIMLIEGCFEGGGDRCYISNNADKRPTNTQNEIIEFYAEKFSNPSERLTAIMENIVRNKGKFLPQQDIATK